MSGRIGNGRDHAQSVVLIGLVQDFNLTTRGIILGSVKLHALGLARDGVVLVVRLSTVAVTQVRSRTIAVVSNCLNTPKPVNAM